MWQIPGSSLTLWMLAAVNGVYEVVPSFASSFSLSLRTLEFFLTHFFFDVIFSWRDKGANHDPTSFWLRYYQWLCNCSNTLIKINPALNTFWIIILTSFILNWTAWNFFPASDRSSFKLLLLVVNRFIYMYQRSLPVKIRGTNGASLQTNRRTTWSDHLLIVNAASI